MLVSLVLGATTDYAIFLLADTKKRVNQEKTANPPITRRSLTYRT